MDYYYYIVDIDGTVTIIKKPEQFADLNFYYENIGCKHIETIPLPRMDINGRSEPVMAVLDDEGAVNGSERNRFLTSVLSNTHNSELIIYGKPRSLGQKAKKISQDSK